MGFLNEFLPKNITFGELKKLNMIDLVELK